MPPLLLSGSEMSMSELLVDPIDSVDRARSDVEPDTIGRRSRLDSPHARRRRRRDRVTLAIPVVALGLWALSLSRVRLDDLPDLGLVSVLPLTYFAAIALLIGGFAV